MLELTVRTVTDLRFDDGAPVRAASGVAPFGGGWLVAQDDATFAAWWRPPAVERLRVLPPVAGRDTFSEEAGTKRDKPDLEAACTVEVGGGTAVLLLGSGSLPVRRRVVLVGPGDPPSVQAADLPALYDRVGAALGVAPAARNLEGACVVGDRLRWFQRGDRRAGVPDASVDLDLATLLSAVRSGDDGGAVALGEVHRYDLSPAGQGALAITDVVALPDGRVLAAAAAEDTPDPVADGPVTSSALVLLDGTAVVGAAALPRDAHGRVRKVEGLALRSAGAGHLDVLAVADQDDPARPSPALELQVRVRPRSSRG